MERLHLPILLALALNVACDSGSESSVEDGSSSGADTTTGEASATGGLELPDVAGKWDSPCFDQGDGTFARLEFDIAVDRWVLDYIVHGDDACSFPVVTVHIEGPYEITGPSSAVDGAFEARFGFDAKTITPHAEPLVMALEDAGCGGGEWSIDGTQDVLENGCAAFGQYPVSACPADFDLVSLDDAGLRFGARPADNDMCTEGKRPAELSPLLLVASD